METFAAHAELLDDGAGRNHQLGRGGAQDLAGHGVAIGLGLRHQSGHRGDHLPAVGPRVHLAHQPVDAVGVGMPQHEGRERGGRTAAIGRAHDGGQRSCPTQKAEPSSPHFAPASRARRGVRRPDAIRDRAGAGDDDDSGLVTGAGHERNVCVVHGHDLAAAAEPPQDAAHDRFVVGPVHPGHPHADRRGHRVLVAERGVHHLVERLLGGQFPGAVQVGTATASLAHHAAVGVGQPGHGLASSRVDPEYVHP